MSGDLPYSIGGYPQQAGGDGRHPLNFMHSGPASQARGYQSQTMLTAQQQQQQYQRLKVEDALSYLDKVKFQFQSQPEIYNKFLDIMKEFKSQTIDTMGVISRVSELFDGHSELIVGFNTFLPPGYKIEMNSTRDSINVYHDGQRVPSLGSTIRSGLPPSQQTATTGHLSAGLGLVHPTSRHLIDTTQQRTASDGVATQPVEFDHAIIYVNKIKSRYHNRPDIYKSFLEILHYYQKVQKDLKDGNPPSIPIMTESEVYDKVAKLFSDQPDLLAEFGQFLPDAGSSSVIKSNSSVDCQRSTSHSVGGASSSGAASAATPPSSSIKKLTGYTASKSSSSLSVPPKTAGHRRRLSASLSATTSQPAPPPVKKLKTELVKDVSLAEAGKYGSLTDFAFFDKIRKMLNSDKAYTDFLRCVKLFTMGVISSSDFIIMIQPFFTKAPELKKRLKEMLRQRDDTTEPTLTAPHSKERIMGEFAMDIDFASCKKFTESYRGLPSSYVPPRCSGRTALCNEVLNDTLVSFPSWSEDSSSVIKKTMAEEQIFRCEEDRYQLDIVLENVNSTILALEGVSDKLSRMTPDDQAKFRLDNCLGGRSEHLHRRTILRLYKEHGQATIDALKRNPAVAVPLVLHRLRAKASQLRDAKRSQQKVWNEQNLKYHLKSLDHQGLNFKQTDMKQLRSKALLAEIETAFEERQEQSGSLPVSPLMSFVYQRPACIDDAAALIIHHVKRQASVHSDEKRKIKRLMMHFLPSLFFLPAGELSDDEDMEQESSEPSQQLLQLAEGLRQKFVENVDENVKSANTLSADRPTTFAGDENSAYCLMFGNNNWYLLMRLHYILCDRLAYFYNHAQKAIEADREKPKLEVPETAYALCLKAPRSVEPEHYYSTLLEMIRNYLDGNIETVTYEEQLRDMFGIHAYIGYTMDKLVQNVVRQLQHIVTDTVCVQLMDMYHSELKADGNNGSDQQHREQSYQRKAEQLLTDDSCFKIAIFKRDCRLVIDLLETDSNQSDNAEDATRAWCDYISQFVTDNDSQSSAAPAVMAADNDDELQQQETQETPVAADAPTLTQHPVYLHRNVRHFQRRNKTRRLLISGNSDPAAEAAASGGDSSEGTGNEGRGRGSEAVGMGLSLMDEVECRFNVNSCRMLYVANSESLLYRENSLTVASNTLKVLSQQRHEKLTSWVNGWLQRTNADTDKCHQFLMGHGTGLVPCQTTCQTANMPPTTTPYYPYHRYVVKYTSVEPQ